MRPRTERREGGSDFGPMNGLTVRELKSRYGIRELAAALRRYYEARNFYRTHDAIAVALLLHVVDELDHPQDGEP